MMLFFCHRFHYKPGFEHPRVRPLYFWTRQFHEHMKRSDNARKFFIFLVIILLTIAQATDLSLLTDFGYMSLGRDKSYIQFGLGMMLTIALFRYSISDKFLSRRFGLVIDYWAVLFLITVLAFLKLIILQDVLCLLLFARCLYPKKEAADDPKGRKSIPDDCHKKRAFRIAASLFV
jgi:hypothetical protein